MYLNRLEIENLRAVRHLALDFGRGTETRRWTVLLGENGCGKTTVLKAAALILSGSAALPELVGDVQEWVRNGANVARIKAEISTAEGEARELSLEIRRGDTRDTIIKRNHDGLAALDAAVGKAERNYFIAGYGAFRRPPDANSSFYSQPGFSRGANVATLFSSSRDLMSLEQWAMELDYRNGAKGRRIIEEALATLLPGMQFKEIDKRGRRILMSTQDGVVPMRNLSEGYQAMAAWAGDILYRMTEIFPDRQNPLHARGVLLIDEMDLHLHPVWKRNFVVFLNKAFPNLQIVATTHSPLSVQQCGEGELYVVQRDAQLGPVLVAFKGDPSKLRLSELFLSPLIGLDTLDSPKIAALRQEARDIELKTGRRSAQDSTRLLHLAQELEGTTPLPAPEAPAFGPAMAVQRALHDLLPAGLLVGSRVRAKKRAASTKSASTASSKKASAKAAKKVVSKRAT